MSFDEELAPPRPKRRKPHNLTSWIRQRAVRDTWLYGLGTLVLFPLSLLVLCITFWLLYGLCLRIAGPWNATHNGLLAAAAFLLLLLFVGNYFLDRKSLEDLDFSDTYRAPHMLMLGYGYGWISGPRSALSSVKIWLTILFLGPRMLTIAGRLGTRVFELQQIDINSCGKILGALLAERRRVSFEELSERYPKLDMDRVKSELSRFDGIVLLRSDPPGMALTPDLEEELIEHIQREREARDDD